MSDLPLLIAGPCSLESEAQAFATAKALKETKKISIFRGGVWKPRTRPNSFEGVGDIGLKWLLSIKQQLDLPVMTEVGTPKHIEACLKYGIDILWIGARTTGSSFVMSEMAQCLKGTQVTMMVKNPLGPDLKLWKGAIERFEKIGLKKIFAIHRGFSAIETNALRNPPQWKIPLELKLEHPDLPIICDPSHICGNKKSIAQVAQLAIDLNFSGLMLEVHSNPNEAISDREQQLSPLEYEKLIDGLTLKRNRSPSKKAKEELTLYRDIIDQVDEKILTLLHERLEISQKIAEIKKKYNLPIFQFDRFESMMKERKSKGEKLNLEKDFVAEIFNSIHEQSIIKQSEKESVFFSHFS